MVNSSAFSLLQHELSLAGFSAEDEQRLRELEACRITPLKELPPVEFLFRLHGKPCFARGELTGLSGKAKSGKTFVCSILMALCFRNEVLSVTRIEPRKLHVLDRFVVPDAKLRLPAECKGEIIRVRTVEEAIQALFK